MKRLISVLLVALMVLSSVVSAGALTGNKAYANITVEETFEVGDVNDDGYVDMKDSLAVRNYCAGVDEDVNASGADLNLDGKVNAKDLLILKKVNAGIDSLSNYSSEEAVDKMTIAGNDIATYSIVYAADAKYVENTYYAADTLRRFIKEATGINLSITTSETTDNVIKFVDVTTVEGLEEELEIENYKYEVVDGDLLVYGTFRGNMYAVYEILEEYLGFRFYNDVFTYQYSARTVDIPEGTSVDHDSYLKFRICKQGFWRSDESHYFPRRLNGSQHGENDEYMGTLTGPHFINAHSFGYYWKMATGVVDVEFDGTNFGAYGAKYNAGVQQDEATWNPCFTSDEIYAVLFRGLLETMRYVQSPGWHQFREETSAMSFSICDNRTVCECIDCRYIMTTGSDKKRGERLNCGEAGLNLYIANRACNDIKEFYGEYVDYDGELWWEGRPAGADETGDAYDNSYYSAGGYGEAIKDVYPNMDLYTILYDHTLPHEKLLTDERYACVAPAENLIIMFCGNPCNNHYMGEYQCGGNKNMLGLNGEEDAEAFAAWGDVTKVTGSEMWFWYYPVNYNTYVTDSPNVFNIWYDFKYVIEECNVSGIYYEGASKGYIFENLKSHLAAQFMWSMVENEDGSVSYMSFDEFVECLKEYLQIHYGKGWEYVYEYLCMQDEASDCNDFIQADSSGNPVIGADGQPVRRIACYINNLDYMGDMFDYEYMGENYEYMRELILKGMALVPASDKQMYQRYEFLLMNVEMIGLSAVRKSWYLDPNADPEKKATYMERYDWLFKFLRDERMNYGDGLNGEEWNGNSGNDEFKRIVVNSNKPLDWMDQVPQENYYEFSPYGLITGDWVTETEKDLNGNGNTGDTFFEAGGETWRKLSEGWEWTGSVPNWGYFG